MNYENNVCPYNAEQLLLAKKVLDWAIKREEIVHNAIHNQTILGLIGDIITNEVVKQVRITRLKDYSTTELEEELELRKNKQL